MKNSIKKIIELEKEVYEQFSNFTEKNNLFLTNESIIGSYSYRFDLVILTKEKRPVCIVEIKNNLKNSDLVKLTIRNHLINVSVRFAILTDGNTYLLFDTLNKDLGFQELSFKDITSKLLDKSINLKINDLVNHINSYLEDYGAKFTICKNDLRIDENSISFTQEMEDKLIKSLFDFSNKGVTKVYRYTTLNTLFKMIEQNSMLLFGLAGMNDISEIDYIGKEIYPNQEHLYHKDINKIFISSCSLDKEDDLTQWRLYAKNGEGVCLTFEVNINNPKFKFFKINYTDVKKDESIILLKNIVEQCIQDTGYPFIYHLFHEWSHFIKPLDYEVENEVRLLYKMNDKDSIDGWILNDETNIINPYKKFELNKLFPFKLKEITLGPKCKESALNIIQLNEMNKNKEYFKNVNIKISSIHNYRY